MLYFKIFLVIFLGTALASPNSRLSPHDREYLVKFRSKRLVTLPANFKHKYLLAGGAIVDKPDPTHPSLLISGSPLTGARGLDWACQTVSKMLRHMPLEMFNRLAKASAVGIFTAKETLTVYPEFKNLANTPQCGTSCDGSCAHTCTFDHRKYETLAGLGSARAVILEDNVLCTPKDGYHHHDNILVHEFSHTVNFNAFDDAMKKRLNDAYANAKAKGIWNLKAYSMANSAEYFAEGAGCFFMVNQQGSPGGMNECGGPGHYCANEMAARQHISQKDPELFAILSHTYTNNRPNTPSGLTVCPP